MSRILLFSLAHFMVAMAVAMIASGPDMDQLRSRSPASRIAAEVHDVLWFPHDAALRALPHAWLIRNTSVIPLAIGVNSLAWGALTYLVSRLFSRRS